MQRTTVVDRIVRELAVAILRGERTPGSMLPQVRALAARYTVTLPTIQRVVAQLEAMGLVAAHQGRGTMVLDPARRGDGSLLPLQIEAFRDQPDRAATLVADFLELRRALAQLVVARIVRSALPVAELHAALEGAVTRLETAAAQGGDCDAVAAADLAFARALIDSAEQTAYAGVFNLLERLVWDVPTLRQAMYARPEENAGALRLFLTQWAAGVAADELAGLLELLLTEADRRTVEGFRASLVTELERPAAGVSEAAGSRHRKDAPC